MKLEWDSPEWSALVAWIIREELSLSRLVLFHIRVTSQNMEQDSCYYLQALHKVMTYNKMAQWLVFDRLAMISDNLVSKSVDIDILILESTEILHEVITEFIRVIDQHAKANIGILVDANRMGNQSNRLLTELLSSIWGLLEIYDISRFSYASICEVPETLKQINQNQPKWLKALTSVINLCHQALIRQSDPSSEAFCFIYKIRGFIQSTAHDSRQSQLSQVVDTGLGNQKNKMKNTSTKPSIFIK